MEVRKTNYRNYTIEDFKKVKDVIEMEKILTSFQSLPTSIYFLDGESDSIELNDKGQETSESLRRRWRTACARLSSI